jgi:hypothetical protein
MPFQREMVDRAVLSLKEAGFLFDRVKKLAASPRVGDLRVTSLRAAPLLAQREDRTEIPVWHQDRRPNPRLPRCGQRGWIRLRSNSRASRSRMILMGRANIKR